MFCLKTKTTTTTDNNNNNNNNILTCIIDNWIQQREATDIQIIENNTIINNNHEHSSLSISASIERERDDVVLLLFSSVVSTEINPSYLLRNWEFIPHHTLGLNVRHGHPGGPPRPQTLPRHVPLPRHGT